MHVKHEPPEETDGPPGAMALAAFLQALEEDVSMVVDQRALSLFKKLVEEALEQGEQWDGGRGGGESAFEDPPCTCPGAFSLVLTTLSPFIDEETEALRGPGHLRRWEWWAGAGTQVHQASQSVYLLPSL